MASHAYTDHLERLLSDVEELIDAHTRLRTGQRGRQWRLGAINRATLVMGVSCWEAFVEHILLESIDLLKPPSPPFGVWQALNASTRSAIGRFNTPSAENVRNLFRDSIGLTDVTQEWYWQNCDTQKATDYLNDVLRKRHEIAHGVNPRPIINNNYASWLPAFVRNLARCTERSLKQYLEQEMGLQHVF